MIKIENLKKTYRVHGQEINAVNNISYSFPETGMVFILGKSGCGKTSLLNAMSGLDSISSGSICVDGKKIDNLSKEALDDFRNLDIGVIFQQYNLISDLTVYQNIEIALKIQNWCNKSAKDVKERIRCILKYIDLDGYENRMINELSGGEKQRVAIARALVKESRIIFADEPTGNLDANTGEKILNLLKRISDDHLIIIVTHDSASAYKYGDQILLLSDGKITKKQSGENLQQSIKFTVSDCCNGRTYTIESDKTQPIIEKLLQLLHETKIGGKSFNISLSSYENPISNLEVNKSPSYDSVAYLNQRSNVSIRHLTLKDKIFFSYLFIKKKKFKLVLTVLLVTITLFLLVAAAFISSYNSDAVLSAYLNKYQPSLLTGYQEMQYEDEFYDIHTFDIKSGPEFADKLSRIVGGKNCIGVKTSMMLTNFADDGDYTMHVDNTIAYINCDGISSLLLSEGRWPLKNDEITITDYIAKKLCVSINDIVQYQGYSLRVVGIVKTDYIEYELERKIFYGSDSPYLSYYYKYKYNIAFVNEKLLEKNKKEATIVPLPVSNFILCNRESQYLNENINSLKYGKITNSINSELIWGKMPEASNEILISEQLAKRFNLLDTNGILKEKDKLYYFIDIQSQKYAGCYSEILNLSHYFKLGVKISGVYLQEGSDTDVLINDDLFKRIKNDYYSSFFYDEYLMNCSFLNYYDSYVSAISDNSIIIDEPAAQQILYFENTVIQILPILLIILFAISLMTFATILNYITISIKENSKNIGVLKSLGVANKDVSSIFLFEFFAVYFESMILSTLIISIFYFFVNHLYSLGLKENVYNIITWNHPLIALLYIIAFVVCVVSAIFPIHKLSKMQPIEIISKNEK